MIYNNIMNQDKKKSIQQKNYTILAILSNKKYNDQNTTVPISLPEETLKPYKHKISHATYISPKQAIKFNIKVKLAQNVKQFQRTKSLFNDNYSIKYQYNFKMLSASLRNSTKKQLIPQQKQKKRNIRQYLHQIAKKNKRAFSKYEPNNYVSDHIYKNNKFKTALIVKNMSLDKKPAKTSLKQIQEQAMLKKSDIPIHQTYSYFFNRKKCRTQQNNRQAITQSQYIRSSQRNKITIQQLCNLRQQLKKCSQSQQIFQKYKKRTTEPSKDQKLAQNYTKEEIDNTINQIYESFYKKPSQRWKLKKSSFSVNKQSGKDTKEQQISPWNKKPLEDNEFI